MDICVYLRARAFMGGMGNEGGASLSYINARLWRLKQCKDVSVCVCMCMGGGLSAHPRCLPIVCVCVCVRERESVCVCMSVYECVCDVCVSV